MTRKTACKQARQATLWFVALAHGRPQKIRDEAKKCPRSSPCRSQPCADLHFVVFVNFAASVQNRPLTLACFWLILPQLSSDRLKSLLELPLLVLDNLRFRFHVCSVLFLVRRN